MLSPGVDTAQCDASSLGDGSYPGGKSGAGIFQRLINLIPPHRVLVVPFAGHCGVVRNIKPAEHTIVIDKDPEVCEWWNKWRRTKNGRDLEIHWCDGIEFVRFRFGCTEYSAYKACDSGSSDDHSNDTGSHSKETGRSRQSRRLVMAGNSPEYFLFCDPPYVLSERATGKIYRHEMSDGDHLRLIGTVTTLRASRYQVMICGYPSIIYSLSDWFSIDHRVPTRGGLQDERIWMNYETPRFLHDYRYIGSDRRERERIRRRQKSWQANLNAMPEQQKLAMVNFLTSLD